MEKAGFYTQTNQVITIDLFQSSVWVVNIMSCYNVVLNVISVLVMALIMSSHNLKTYVGLGSLEIQNDPVSKQAICKMHEWGYFH